MWPYRHDIPVALWTLFLWPYKCSALRYNGQKRCFFPKKQHYCPMLAEGGCSSSLGRWHRVFLWLQGFGVPMALGHRIPMALGALCPWSPRVLCLFYGDTTYACSVPIALGCDVSMPLGHRVHVAAGLECPI